MRRVLPRCVARAGPPRGGSTLTATARSARLPAMDPAWPLDLGDPLLDALGHHPLIEIEAGRRRLLAVLAAGAGLAFRQEAGRPGRRPPSGSVLATAAGRWRQPTSPATGLVLSSGERARVFPPAGGDLSYQSAGVHTSKGGVRHTTEWWGDNRGQQAQKRTPIGRREIAKGTIVFQIKI
jgi:hypothetical protein